MREPFDREYERNHEAEKRLAQLRLWKAEDHAHPERPLLAPTRWRDEVMSRLPYRPIKCRMPELIASLLMERGMCSEGFILHRCVLIGNNGSVSERTTGRILVDALPA